MNTVICRVCHQISSVSSNTQAIRCYHCSRTIFVGNNSNLESDLSPCRRRSSSCLNFRLRTSWISVSSGFSIKGLPPPKGKRALLCGVSYKDQKFKLKGTIQDVHNMKKLLLDKFSFSSDVILILAEQEGLQLPTRENILRGFEWLTKNQQEKDSLLFYYSGHGQRTLDLKAEEVDGFDEAICPVDFHTEGIIIDNLINEKLVQELKRGVTLHAIIDSCHSGTMLDLPHVYNRNKGDWDPPHHKRIGTDGGKAICISACEDYQLASDISMLSTDKTAAGAMTLTFIQAMNVKKGAITYYDILEYMHRSIEEANRTISRGFRRFFHRQMLQVVAMTEGSPCRIPSYLLLKCSMSDQSSSSNLEEEEEHGR